MGHLSHWLDKRTAGLSFYPSKSLSSRVKFRQYAMILHTSQLKIPNNQAFILPTRRFQVSSLAGGVLLKVPMVSVAPVWAAEGWTLLRIEIFTGCLFLPTRCFQVSSLVGGVLFKAPMVSVAPVWAAEGWTLLRIEISTGCQWETVSTYFMARILELLYHSIWRYIQ